MGVQVSSVEGSGPWGSATGWMDEPFPSQPFRKSQGIESVASLWIHPHSKLQCPQRAEKVSYVFQIKNSTSLPVFLCIVRPGTSLCSNDGEKGNSQGT